MSMDEARQNLKVLVKLELGTGKERARTGKWISALTGINERDVRQLIEDLRADGELIINDQDGAGYYIADSLDDVERQYRRDYGRAMALLSRLKPMRKILRISGRLKTKSEIEKETNYGTGQDQVCRQSAQTV